MAQFRTDLHKIDSGQVFTRYEVNMLSDRLTPTGEYKIGGSTITGGRILASGYTTSTTQSSIPVDILREALFKFQLERNGLTNTPYELTLCAAASFAGLDIYASMDWEEITR